MYNFQSSLVIGDINEQFNNEILNMAFPGCDIIMNNDISEMKYYDILLKTSNFERTIEYKFDLASKKYGNFFIEVFMYDEKRGIYPGCFSHTKADYFFHSNINNIWVRDTKKMKLYLRKHDKVKKLCMWVKDNEKDIMNLLGECALKRARASNIVREHYGDDIAHLVKIVPNQGRDGFYCAIGFVENVSLFNKNCGYKYHWPHDFKNKKKILCNKIIKKYLDKLV